MNQRPLPYLLAAFVLGEVWIEQFQATAAFAALILVAAVILYKTAGIKKSSFFLLICFLEREKRGL